MGSGDRLRVTEARGRELVFGRANGVCEGCGLRLDRGLGHSWAHRTPKGLGGTWAAPNGLALCGTGTTGCHGWAEHHPGLSELLGWRVLPYQDPREVPACLFTEAYGWAWVLLDDDGCVSWVDRATQQLAVYMEQGTR